MRERFTQHWLCVCLAFTAIIFFLLPTSFVNNFYLPKIFSPIANALNAVTSKTAFPIGQLVFYLGVFTLLIFTILKVKIAIKERKWSTLKKPAFQLLKLFLVVFILFQLSYGLSFKRPGLANHLQLDTNRIQPIELQNFTLSTINWCNEHISDFDYEKDSFKNMVKWTHESYEHLIEKHGYFLPIKPSVKRVIEPTIMSRFGISGIYFPFTAEANVNGDIPAVIQPFVIAHEMAHQKGIAPENEANFSAYLAGINSDNISLQFSAKYAALRYCLAYTVDSVLRDSLFNLCNESLRNQIEEHSAYWQNYRGLLGKISSQVNNAFLKFNGQQDGIKSYGNFLSLVLAWERKTQQNSTYRYLLE
ncbi:MAG: DUF3810 domain-containing protein [Bacteroidetes bacterium]|nr:DUF3810 domain-containing protein [Bacteroidota bacterium]